MDNTNILAILADNTSLFEATKAVVLKQFNILLSSNDLTRSNQELGEVVRAGIIGKQVVKDAFKEIALHKTVEHKPESTNPGR